MLKGRKKKEQKSDFEKEYIVVTNEGIPMARIKYMETYHGMFPHPVSEVCYNINEKLYFMDKQEIIDFVKKYGNNNIVHISKNNKVDIEQIVNVKEN